MGPFDDSFGGFEEIFNRFAGKQSMQTRQNNSSEDLMETLELENGTYVILDFSSRKIKDVQITDDVQGDEYGEKLHTGKKYLQVLFQDEEKVNYVLPKKFQRDTFEWTEKNGILEVYFEK